MSLSLHQKPRISSPHHIALPLPCLVLSVTRFGEILPLWHNFQKSWAHFVGLFSIWQNFDPTEAKVFKLFILQVFVVVPGWPNAFKQFSHLVTLQLCLSRTRNRWQLS